MVNMNVVDAVQKMLESDGSMLKIRAQLKCNVANVLKGRGDLNAPIQGNAAVEEYISEENKAKGNHSTILYSCSLSLSHTRLTTSSHSPPNLSHF